MSTDERVKRVMADILEMSPAEISSKTTKEVTSTWDSLAQINMASALEEEFDVSFTIADIEAMTSYDSIHAIVSRKL